MLVTAAGVIPDIDGLVIIGDLITQKNGQFLPWYDEFHRVLAHNIVFAILITLLTLMISKRRWMCALLVSVSFHIHLLGDLVGSAGRDGSKWSIAYFWPFSNWQLTWDGQWALSAWPNIVISIIALVLTFFLAWKRGFSPLELISRDIDTKFVAALHNRFGKRNRINCTKQPRT